MPPPSVVQPFNYRKGILPKAMSPRASWKYRRMSSYETQQIISFNIREYCTLSIAGILIIHLRISSAVLWLPSLVNNMIELWAVHTVPADGYDPQHRPPRLARIQPRTRHQSEQRHIGAKAKQDFTYTKQLWHSINNSDMFKTLWTLSSFFFFYTAVRLLLARLWALKQNNACAWYSSNQM